MCTLKFKFILIAEKKEKINFILLVYIWMHCDIVKKLPFEAINLIFQAEFYFTIHHKPDISGLERLC